MEEKFVLFHFVLYSKGWYKRFDPRSTRKSIWDDLRCTMTGDDYSGEFMTKSDIVLVVLNNCQRLDIRAFTELPVLLSGISVENCWKYGYYCKENAHQNDTSKFPNYDYWEAVIRYCLSAVANCEISAFYKNLPEPDSKVLPLKNGISRRKMNEIFNPIEA